MNISHSEFRTGSTCGRIHSRGIAELAKARKLDRAGVVLDLASDTGHLLHKQSLSELEVEDTRERV